MTGAILLLVLAGNPAAGSQDTLDTALAQYSQRCNASKPDLDACVEAAWIHVSGKTSTPDFVACFQYEADARRFRTALDGRLGKFQLEVEPSKTRILRFGRFAKRDVARRGASKWPSSSFWA